MPRRRLQGQISTYVLLGRVTDIRYPAAHEVFSSKISATLGRANLCRVCCREMQASWPNAMSCTFEPKHAIRRAGQEQQETGHRWEQSRSIRKRKVSSRWLK